jgi:hypothetical protein
MEQPFKAKPRKWVKGKMERIRVSESFLELVNDFLATSSYGHLTRDRSKLYRKLILKGMLQWCKPDLVERINQEMILNEPNRKERKRAQRVADAN